MQDGIWECGKNIKKAKDGKYIDGYYVKIWNRMNEWLDVAQEIR